MKNQCRRNVIEFDLTYDGLFYSLGDVVSKKYDVWGETVPQSVKEYVRRKAKLLPNGVR